LRRNLFTHKVTIAKKQTLQLNILLPLERATDFVHSEVLMGTGFGSFDDLKAMILE
jgi:hypothetical protein